ncbi:hypothetical protein R1flu_019162 [Riccia fluitans]|uniref:Phosphatidic acid phosphatase type 2/haloperoxidase domain-containing protein n=1 Tax=Riccia fluitans TaxID=41844 RepID=A0ABD1ZLR6_9MARC
MEMQYRPYESFKKLGKPLEGLDEIPIRGATGGEPQSRSTESIPDLKLGQLFKHHWKDWVVIVLLFITAVVLNVIYPFRRYIGSFNIDSVKYPHKDNTVPTWSVPIFAVLFPIFVFLGYFFKRRNVRDLHHAILGILTASFLTGVITEAIKNGVGRPRPDFFWRCFPDGNQMFDEITGNVLCHGTASVIKEGYKSFPSGHASWSFAGLGYLSFYLAGKVVVFDKRGFTWRLSLIVLPLLGAAMVAVSRVDDYWHYWQDVFVGGLLGLTVAYFCYKQHFPDFGDENSGHPHPHLHITLPLAPYVSEHDSLHPIHSTRPVINGRSHDGWANGGSYDIENGS